MKILVTGATGFVGKTLCKKLVKDGVYVIAAVRKPVKGFLETIEQFETGDLSDKIDWTRILHDIDVVVHVAGRAHIINDVVFNPLTEFRKINTLATLSLADQAADAGVKRFVFVSSVKVNGEKTEHNIPFSPDDSFIPDDFYGLSKYEAEQGLLKISKDKMMDVVIIRPPLVYGPGVKANFLTMLDWVNKGIPLPFGSINNQRSFVAIENLISFIVLCIKAPKAANEIFLISDQEDVSTTELLKKVANAFGKEIMLISLPSGMMTNIAKLVGKENVTKRLFNSLHVDSSKAKELLGWKPVITMSGQLEKTVSTYLNEKNI